MEILRHTWALVTPSNIEVRENLWASSITFLNTIVSLLSPLFALIFSQALHFLPLRNMSNNSVLASHSTHFNLHYFQVFNLFFKRCTIGKCNRPFKCRPFWYRTCDTTSFRPFFIKPLHNGDVHCQQNLSSWWLLTSSFTQLFANFFFSLGMLHSLECSCVARRRPILCISSQCCTSRAGVPDWRGARFILSAGNQSQPLSRYLPCLLEA